MAFADSKLNNPDLNELTREMKEIIFMIILF